MSLSFHGRKLYNSLGALYMLRMGHYEKAKKKFLRRALQCLERGCLFGPNYMMTNTTSDT